jgi:hypothetical protein
MIFLSFNKTQFSLYVPVLSLLANWYDHSRDLLHMVNHFRDEIPRPIVGVAHSMGCAQM